MHRVNVENLGGWATRRDADGTWVFPQGVYEVCPHCGKRGAFNLEHRVGPDQLAKGGPVKSVCPSCRQMVRFYLIEPGGKEGSDWTGELWLHPSPKVRRAKPLTGLLPPGLAHTYSDAIESYNHGLYRGAAGQARVVLEGAVKTLLTDIEGSPVDPREALARLLDELGKKKDLAKPIKDVSQVMREGGNLASHFNEDKPIGPDLATEMLDLLDAFLDYLLLLPQMVERLRDRLETAP
jgi:Domain of unknown function (DUF4145)